MGGGGGGGGGAKMDVKRGVHVKKFMEIAVDFE